VVTCGVLAAVPADPAEPAEADVTPRSDIAAVQEKTAARTGRRCCMVTLQGVNNFEKEP
jgi:NAD(P)-dependent dehydrogenase (short-subunit alcohol dehydrogenase family)